MPSSDSSAKVHVAPAETIREIPEVINPVMSVRDTSVFYGSFRAVTGVTLDFGHARDHRPHRPVRMRQVDAPPIPQPHERPHPGREGRGRDRLPGRGHLRTRRRRDRGAPSRRHGLPEAQPVSQVRLRQHRLRPARHRDEGREHGRPRRVDAHPCGAVGRGQGQAQAVRLRALGRPAAAAVHRADHRGRAGRHPHGRAVLRTRPHRDHAASRTSCRNSPPTTRSSS